MKLEVATGTKIAICSVAVGIAAGLGAIAFRYLIHGASTVFFEWTVAPLGWMGAHRIIVIPALGALVVANVIAVTPSVMRGRS